MKEPKIGDITSWGQIVDKQDDEFLVKSDVSNYCTRVHRSSLVYDIVLQLPCELHSTVVEMAREYCRFSYEIYDNKMYHNSSACEKSYISACIDIYYSTGNSLLIKNKQ